MEVESSQIFSVDRDVFAVNNSTVIEMQTSKKSINGKCITPVFDEIYPAITPHLTHENAVNALPRPNKSFAGTRYLKALLLLFSRLNFVNSLIFI